MHKFIGTVLLLGAFGLPGFANTILAIGQNNHLYSIIPSTGVLTDLGTLPTPAVGGYGDLAYDAFNSTLYAVSFDSSGTLNSVLYSIPIGNPSAAAIIGSTGVIGMNALEVSPTGTLYGVGSLGLNTLYTINQTTGAATSVGTGTYASTGDLEYVSGTLYLTSSTPASDTLFIVNAGTGAGTALGSPIGFSNVFGLALDDTSGILYGFTNPGSGSGQVISINVATGVGTLVHTYSNLFIGATDIDGASVPEPGTIGTMAFGAVALLGFAYRRRRVKA